MEKKKRRKLKVLDSKSFKNTPSELLNFRELAEALSVSVHTVRKWRLEGKIPCYKLGKSVRFDVKEVIFAMKGRS